MKLIKRKDSPSAPYYARFQIRGRAYLWSTKTNEINLARKRAHVYHEAILSEAFHVVSGMKARNGSISFQCLMDDYRTFPEPADVSRAQNISALRRIVIESGLNLDTGIDRVGADLALNWQRKGKAQGVAVATINSILRSARSLFSKRSMLLYKTKPSPERVREFFSVPALREAEQRPQLPTEAADALVRADIVAYPEMYRAYALAKWGGLRSAEIIAARKDWIEGNTINVGGRPTEFVTKSKRWRPVALAPEVVAILLGGEGEYIVGANRTAVVEDHLIAFLLARGMPAVKPLHSLRRQFGSDIYNNQSPNAARIALGHRDLTTTEKFYARTSKANIAAPVAFTPPPVPPPPPAPVA
jgi:integrase